MILIVKNVTVYIQKKSVIHTTYQLLNSIPDHQFAMFSEEIT